MRLWMPFYTSDVSRIRGNCTPDQTPATNICEVLAKGGAGAQKVTRGVSKKDSGEIFPGTSLVIFVL